MPFGLQPLHLVLIAIVALLLFSPGYLPKFERLRRGDVAYAKGWMTERQSHPAPVPASIHLRVTVLVAGFAEYSQSCLSFLLSAMRYISFWKVQIL